MKTRTALLAIGTSGVLVLAGAGISAAMTKDPSTTAMHEATHPADDHPSIHDRAEVINPGIHDHPGPDDHPGHSDPPSPDNSPTDPFSTPVASGRVIPVAEVGTVAVTATGAILEVTDTTAMADWHPIVEFAHGRDVEVSFRNGSARVDLNVELEDGEMRIRVRDRRVENRADDAHLSERDGHGDDHHDDWSGRHDHDHG